MGILAIFLGASLPLAFSVEEKPKDLKLFFQQNCTVCHGEKGDARGPDGKKLKGADFTRVRWQKRTRDDEMVDAILTGKWFGKAMPAFKDRLTKEEAQRMVTEIIRPFGKEKNPSSR